MTGFEEMEKEILNDQTYISPFKARDYMRALASRVRLLEGMFERMIKDFEKIRRSP